MKKSFVSIVSLVIAAMMLFSFAAVAVNNVLGDFTGDNKVTSSDAIFVLRHVLFPEDYRWNELIDFTNDGVTTSDDAIYLLRHVLFPNDYPLEVPSAGIQPKRIKNITYENHNYILYTGSYSWDQAESFCEQMGGYLVCITTAAEQSMMLAFKGTEYEDLCVWIGGYKDNYGNWKWVSGESWSYSNWADGEPNNQEYENRVSMWPKKWNDLNNNNTSEQFGFICEIALGNENTCQHPAGNIVTDPGVAPTCTKSGLTAGKHCSACGKVIVAQETIAATGHKAVTVYGYAATCTQPGLTDGSYCSVCGATIVAQTTIPSLGHNWGTGTVTAPATCTAQGVKTYKCSRCGGTKNETISALGHTIVIDHAVAPTYTSTGLTEGKHCSVCGKVIVAQQIIPKLVSNDPTPIPEDLSYIYYSDLPKSAVSANTTTVQKYLNHWEWWSQGASAYGVPGKNLRKSGCYVVAQSKLLAEAGLVPSDPAIWNPDTLYDWGYQRYWGLTGNDGTAEKKVGYTCKYYCSEVLGIDIEVGSRDASSYDENRECSEIMDLLYQGYYVILTFDGHMAYVGRTASLAAGEPVILNSSSGNIYWRNCVVKYSDYGRYGDALKIYYYSIPVIDSDPDAVQFNKTKDYSAKGYYAKITSDSTAIRKEPSSTSDVVRNIYKGDIILVTASGKNLAGNTWYKTTDGYVFPLTSSNNGEDRFQKITTTFVFFEKDVKDYIPSLNSNDYLCFTAKENTNVINQTILSFGVEIWLPNANYTPGKNGKFIKVAEARNTGSLGSGYAYYSIKSNLTTTFAPFYAAGTNTPYEFQPNTTYYYRYFVEVGSGTCYSYDYKNMFTFSSFYIQSESSPVDPNKYEDIKTFNNSIDTSVAGYYVKITSDSTAIRNAPSSASSVVRNITKGETIYVYASGKNQVGNTWYKTDGGYVYPLTSSDANRFKKASNN